MKIIILLSIYSEYETLEPLLDELRCCKEHQFTLKVCQGADITALRNFIINDGKSQEKIQDPLPNFDFGLILDSDNYGTLEDILSMIEMDKDIACLPSLEHKSDTKYICGMFGKVPGNKGLTFDTKKKGKYKIDWTSMGGVLFKTNILPKIEYPWFRKTMITIGTKQSQTSEGIGFCLNAKNHGFDIWCNFDNPLGHKKRSAKDFNFNNQSQKQRSIMPQEQEQNKIKLPPSLAEAITESAEINAHMNVMYKNCFSAGIKSQAENRELKEKITKLEAEISRLKTTKRGKK